MVNARRRSGRPDDPIPPHGQGDGNARRRGSHKADTVPPQNRVLKIIVEVRVPLRYVVENKFATTVASRRSAKLEKKTKWSDRL